jgi:hypothetical protein
VGLRCSPQPAGRCRGTITLDIAAGSAKKASASRNGRRRVIGRAHFSVKSGKLTVAKVHISRNGRRRILRRRKLRCRASVAVRSGNGARAVVLTTLTLVAPRSGK